MKTSKITDYFNRRVWYEASSRGSRQCFALFTHSDAQAILYEEGIEADIAASAEPFLNFVMNKISDEFPEYVEDGKNPNIYTIRSDNMLQLFVPKALLEEMGVPVLPYRPAHSAQRERPVPQVQVGGGFIYDARDRFELNKESMHKARSRS